MRRQSHVVAGKGRPVPREVTAYPALRRYLDTVPFLLQVYARPVRGCVMAASPAVVRQSGVVAELLIARNPDPGSKLPFLLRVPLGPGLVFRTSGAWPRTKALFCYPVGLTEWPDQPEIVE